MLLSIGAGLFGFWALDYFTHSRADRWNAVGDWHLILSATLIAAAMATRPFHSVSSYHKMAAGTAAVIAFLFLAFGLVFDGTSISHTVVPAAIVLVGAASRGVGHERATRDGW